MQAEQLIYGVLNGSDYQLKTTPNILNIVSDEELIFLCHIGERETENCRKLNWTENWVSVSFIYLSKDRYSRRVVKNHTFLMRMADLLTLIQPISLFEKYAIQDTEVPDELKPLEIGRNNHE